jgi:hypothetical protein
MKVNKNTFNSTVVSIDLFFSRLKKHNNYGGCRVNNKQEYKDFNEVRVIYGVVYEKLANYRTLSLTSVCALRLF